MGRTAGVKRVVVELPAPLYDRTERATRELAITRSELIRKALERYIERLRRQALARELAEGYQANAGLDRHLSDDFKSVDFETF